MSIGYSDWNKYDYHTFPVESREKGKFIKHEVIEWVCSDAYLYSCHFSGQIMGR